MSGTPRDKRNGTDSLKRLMAHMDRTDEDRHRAFCRFLEGDDKAKFREVLLAFYEEVRECAAGYMCNFDHLVTEDGRRFDIVEVMAEIDRFTDAMYEKLAGVPYIPKICRTAALRREREKARGDRLRSSG